jgi:hypothetical protein
VLKPGLKKGQWTNEEDAHLAQLVQAGWKNWSVIAGEIHGRTSKQCRERWFHHLDPSINRSAYTEEEDALVLAQHDTIGGKWAQIARMMNGRTGEAVKIRFKTLDRHRKSGSTSRCPQITRRRRQFSFSTPASPSSPSSSFYIPSPSPDHTSPSMLSSPARGRSNRTTFVSQLQHLNTQAVNTHTPVHRVHVKKEKGTPPGELDWISSMLEEVEKEADLGGDLGLDELLFVRSPAASFVVRSPTAAHAHAHARSHSHSHPHPHAHAYSRSQSPATRKLDNDIFGILMEDIRSPVAQTAKALTPKVARVAGVVVKADCAGRSTKPTCVTDFSDPQFSFGFASALSSPLVLPSPLMV